MSPRLANEVTVSLLEEVLFSHFPNKDAEAWDNCGLCVGDPNVPVMRICLALDPDADAVRKAAALGCDVLMTHHPVYVTPPDGFMPSCAAAPDAGSAVFEAARNGVALMAFHTCLDRAEIARNRIPRLLDLEVLHPLEGWAEAVSAGTTPSVDKPAYGAVCKLPEGMTLDDLARLCNQRLGGSCRVWGEGEKTVSTLAICSGSAGELADEALLCGADVMMSGEMRYHPSVDLLGRGINVIELGHDVSELPHVECLRETLIAEGFAPEAIEVVNAQPHWHAV